MTPPEEDDVTERTMFISRDQLFELMPEPDPIAHYLVVLEGTTPGRRLEIGASPITIGRGASQTIVCDDRDVSRQHARVLLVNGAVVAEDLQSTNGTFVDEARITASTPVREGARIRMGGQVFKYERRSRSDVKKQQELDRDIQKANTYVMSLLPAPIPSGLVRAEWRFVPSAQLGGDAFGYYWLDPKTFVLYLVDVSGHGVGSAMHSVSVLNVLRQRALPHVDFTNPSEVLASLNERFPTSEHNGLYFTMWYGVYRTDTRVLTYGTAGHGPAILVPPDKSGTEHLGMSAVMIGMLPDQTYDVANVVVPPGSTLFVFSDGAYEIVTKKDERWDLENFEPLLLLPSVPGQTEPERVYRAIKEVAKAGPLDDDFSLMGITFPDDELVEGGLGAHRGLVFQSGERRESGLAAPAWDTGFSAVKYYYSNLIDYLRVALCLLAAGTLALGQPLLTGGLLLGSALLDWPASPRAAWSTNVPVFAPLAIVRRCWPCGCRPTAKRSGPSSRSSAFRFKWPTSPNSGSACARYWNLGGTPGHSQAQTRQNAARTSSGQRRPRFTHPFTCSKIATFRERSSRSPRCVAGICS